MSDAKPVQVEVPAGGEKITISTASCMCRINRSFLSSKATAPVAISGARACGYSTRRYKRSTAASARFTGWKCTPARKANKAYNTWLPDETVAAAAPT